MKESLALAGTRNLKSIADALEKVSKECNLIGPSAVGIIPGGFSVMLSLISINPDPEVGEVYKVNGKLALGKGALNKIALCAGIIPDTERCRRLDSGKNPYYCRYRSVVVCRQIDGSFWEGKAEREIDLRDGSPLINGLMERYEAAMEKYKQGSLKFPPSHPAGQIREMRIHIQSHTETKSLNRAIRNYGVNSTYSPEELKKPFAVLKVVWTGIFDDPRLTLEAARLQMHEQIHVGGSRRALYGGGQAPQLPSAGQDFEDVIDAPPIGAMSEEDCLETIGELVQHTESAAMPSREREQEREPSARATRTPTAAAPTPTQASEDDGSLKITFGQAKGKTIQEAESSDLEWLEKVVKKNIDDPEKARFRTANQKFLAAIVAELERRSGVVPNDMDRGDDPNNY